MGHVSRSTDPHCNSFCYNCSNLRHVFCLRTSSGARVHNSTTCSSVAQRLSKLRSLCLASPRLACVRIVTTDPTGDPSTRPDLSCHVDKWRSIHL
jgi:hypothetical protein